MTTDPRIEAAAKAMDYAEGTLEGIATAALAAADAVDPLRNPTDADIERAARVLEPWAWEPVHDRSPMARRIRRSALETARAVVAALRGGLSDG